MYKSAHIPALMHSEGGVRRQTNGHLDSDLIRHLGWLLQEDHEPTAARVHVDNANMHRRPDVPPVQLFSHTPAMPVVPSKRTNLFEPPHQVFPAVASQINLVQSNSSVLPLAARRDSSGSDVRPMSMQRQMSLPSSAEAAGGGNSRSATSQERLERIREKNRRASTRFREKQKREREEMATRASDLQSRIQAAKEHREVLQQQRTGLAARSTTATSCLCVLRETFHDLCRAALPETALPAPPGSLFRDPLDPLPPLSAYDAHAPLSLKMVLDCLPTAASVATADQFVRSVHDAKASAAALLELPAERVCWHIQSEYEVAEGSYLSFSAALRSLECVASVQLQHHAVLLEMAFLQSAQHHGAAHPPSFSGSHNLDDPEHKSTQPPPWTPDAAEDTPPPPPTLPSSAVDPLRVRCGVHSSAPLAAAVEHIFRKLLRAYLPRMPYAAWRSVCIRMLRLLHVRYSEPLRPEIPDTLLPGSPDCAQHADSAGAALDHLLCAIGQLAAAALCAELQAAESGVALGPRNGSYAAASATHDRHTRLQYLSALSSAETLSCAPVVSRQLIMRMAVGSPCAPHKMEGIVTQGFQGLSLPAPRKAALARAWQQWICHRSALDQPLHAVLCALESMPAAATLCTALDGQCVTSDMLSPSGAAAAAAAPCTRSGLRQAEAEPPAKLRRRSSSPPAAVAGPALPPLLGQDAAITAAAANAMSQAADAHERDMRLQTQHAVMLGLPSPLLSPQHHQSLCGLLVDMGLLCLDRLHLCRIAADEQRHRSLLLPIPACTLPRPE